METQFYNTIIYSGIAGLSTIIGILLVLYAKEFTRKNSIYLVSFAAGVLLGFSFIHLIPDSIQIYKYSLYIVLLGFLIFYLIEHFIMRHSFHESYTREHTAGNVAAIGLFFHSLIDGIVIAAGFEISRELGLIATIAVIAHELPEGVTSMAVLLHNKIKKKTAILYSYLIALATPVGALLTLLLFRNISKEFLGILIALAAGSFLYIGASDLVPETHERYNKLNAAYLILGILFVIIISLIFSS